MSTLLVSYDFASLEYTKRFTHSEFVNNDEGELEIITFFPKTVINRREFSKLLNTREFASIEELLDAMRSFVGVPCPHDCVTR